MENRLISFLLSLCLHLGVAALALFLPSLMPPPPPPPETAVMVDGLFTLGAPGKMVEGAKYETPKGGGGMDKPQAPIEQPKPQVEQKAPTQVEAPVKAEAKPEVKPVPKPPEEKKPEPKPEPEATPVAQKREDKKPEEKKAEEKKPEDKKPESKPDDKKSATPAKAQPKSGSLNDALADMNKQVKSRGPDRGSGLAGGTGRELSAGLDELAKKVGGSGNDDSGRGPGGSGGDGMGRLGRYEQMLVSRIKPNWAYPERADRKNFVATVYIVIEPDGTISESRLVGASGDSYFDAPVLNAIAATAIVEPPEKGTRLEINVGFSLAMLRGR